MILITGATGFVGSALARRLVIDDSKFEVRAAVRSNDAIMPRGVHGALVGDISANTDWKESLKNVSTVVHLAARVHVMNDTIADPLSEFRRVNVQGTLNLAKQAAEAGVRRFLFISSIKVNGEQTIPGDPFRAEKEPTPADPYGISKLEAEQGLKELASRTGMDVVIIRPPLVYGPGVKANFQSMMRWLQLGIPLPLGAIRNQRSLVSLDNLIDLITVCIGHPAAVNQTFLVSDGEDLSTPQLLMRMGRALGSPARLLPVPTPLLNFAGALTGKGEIIKRLCESLQVDITHTRKVLEWTPPQSVDEGLKKTAEGFLREAHL